MCRSTSVPFPRAEGVVGRILEVLALDRVRWEVVVALDDDRRVAVREYNTVQSDFDHDEGTRWIQQILRYFRSLAGYL
jgi:hypothetical protein